AGGGAGVDGQRPVVVRPVAQRDVERQLDVLGAGPGGAGRLDEALGGGEDGDDGGAVDLAGLPRETGASRAHRVVGAVRDGEQHVRGGEGLQEQVVVVVGGGPQQLALDVVGGLELLPGLLAGQLPVLVAELLPGGGRAPHLRRAAVALGDLPDEPGGQPRLDRQGGGDAAGGRVDGEPPAVVGPGL